MDNNALDIEKRTKPIIPRAYIITFTIAMALIGLLGLVTVILDFNLLVKL